MLRTLDRLACFFFNYDKLTAGKVNAYVHLPVVRISLGTNCREYDSVMCAFLPSLRQASLNYYSTFTINIRLSVGAGSTASS